MALPSRPTGGTLHLSDVISKHNEKKIFWVPPNETDDIETQLQKQLQTNGVVFDLRLGSEAFLSGETKKRTLTDGNPFITIMPGQFALLTTYELVDVPLEFFAFISMRFGTKQGGLINISGFHVDPGFQGMLIFSVYNAGTHEITMKFRDEVFMMIFSKLTQPLTSRPGRFEKIQEHLEAKHVAQIIGPTISPMLLEKRIRKLEMWNKVNWGLALTLGGSIIAVLATFAGPFIKFVIGAR